jgi:hypothetical protein
MDHTIALSYLPSCFALQIRAQLSGSLQWFCLCVHPSSFTNGRSSFNPSRTFFHQLLGRYHPKMEAENQ